MRSKAEPVIFSGEERIRRSNGSSRWRDPSRVSMHVRVTSFPRLCHEKYHNTGTYQPCIMHIMQQNSRRHAQRCRDALSRQRESSHSDLCNNVSTEFTSAPGNRDILIKKNSITVSIAYILLLYICAQPSAEKCASQENQLLSYKEKKRENITMILEKIFYLLSKKTVDNDIGFSYMCEGFRNAKKKKRGKCTRVYKISKVK